MTQHTTSEFLNSLTEERKDREFREEKVFVRKILIEKMENKFIIEIFPLEFDDSILEYLSFVKKTIFATFKINGNDNN